MRAVWIYEIKPGGNRLPMPQRSEVLSVAVVLSPCFGPTMQLWALVDTAETLGERHIQAVATGPALPDGCTRERFVGTVQLFDSSQIQMRTYKPPGTPETHALHVFDLGWSIPPP